MGTTISASTANEFLSLSESQQRELLKQMSNEEKKQLDRVLTVRSAEGRPGVPRPGVDMKGSDSLSGAATDFAMETGRKGEELKRAFVGGKTPPKGLPPIGGIDSGAQALTLGEHMIEGIPESVKSIGRELLGHPQPGMSVLSRPDGIGQRVLGAMSVAEGGDPESARLRRLEGRPGAAVADVSGIPIMGLLLGHVAGKVLPTLSDVEGAEINPQRKQLAAMQRVMGREAIHAGPVEGAERMAQVQDLWKQSAREMGLTDKELSVSTSWRVGRTLGRKGAEWLTGKKAADYVGQLNRDSQRALDIASKAVDIADRPANTLAKSYATTEVPQISSTVADELDRMAGETVDTPLKNALHRMSEKVRKAKTVEDLNQIKIHANKEARALYSNVPGKEIGNSAQATYAYRLAADEIRSRLYPTLQKMAGPNSGIDLSALGRREADSIAVRDGMYRTYYTQVIPDQANKEALKFGEYIFGEGPDHSFYTRHFYRRAAEGMELLPGAQGMFNIISNRGVGPLGEGAIGESTTAMGNSQRLLADQSAPTHFTIPTGLPEEITTPGKLSTRYRYEGAERVPNPDYQPLDRKGTGYISKTPAGEQKAALGASGEAVPDETFTGPRERTITRWQAIVEGEGPTVRTEGGGQLRTQDPKLAQDTVDRIDQALKYKRFSPEQRARLQVARDNLQTQLDQYDRYWKNARRGQPTHFRYDRGRKGVRTVSRRVSRRLTGLGIGAGIRNLPALSGTADDQGDKPITSSDEDQQ